jgi:hypothetical protein
LPASATRFQPPRGELRYGATRRARADSHWRAQSAGARSGVLSACGGAAGAAALLPHGSAASHLADAGRQREELVSIAVTLV